MTKAIKDALLKAFKDENTFFDDGHESDGQLYNLIRNNYADFSKKDFYKLLELFIDARPCLFDGNEQKEDLINKANKEL